MKTSSPALSSRERERERERRGGGEREIIGSTDMYTIHPLSPPNDTHSNRERGARERARRREKERERE
jgi:protein subunit release factor B